MIRNQWYVVLDSKEVKAGKPVGVTRLGEKLVFWRSSAGQVNCIHDLCPHLGADLSQGKVIGNCLACPFHGFEFNQDGQCVYLPAIGRAGIIPKALRSEPYCTVEAHGYIWIWWGDPQKVQGEPKWFDIDDHSFSYAGFKEQWPVHYSRMVENQLDVVHLPFVHSNTIGAGGRTVVDGPIVKLENDVLYLWVYNRKDDGTPPLKPEDLPEPQRPPYLVLNFPNLWQNRISEDVRITAAFVPIDEENSMIYIRSYQRFVRVPVVRELVNAVTNWASIYITHQDRRVVRNQRPKKTALKKMGEVITLADRAILAYRSHRHALKSAAGQVEE
jgi:phenylpropionate dioxygenase-like ring-hydroxylating dioxygenase large terminal subunit